MTLFFSSQLDNWVAVTSPIINCGYRGRIIPKDFVELTKFNTTTMCYWNEMGSLKVQDGG